MSREIISLALRMASPLRNEFDFALDTERTLKDEGYVRTLNELVSRSHNPRLQEYFAELAVCLDELWGTECPEITRRSTAQQGS